MGKYVRVNMLAGYLNFEDGRQWQSKMATWMESDKTYQQAADLVGAYAYDADPELEVVTLLLNFGESSPVQAMQRLSELVEDLRDA